MGGDCHSCLPYVQIGVIWFCSILAKWLSIRLYQCYITDINIVFALCIHMPCMNLIL